MNRYYIPFLFFVAATWTAARADLRSFLYPPEPDVIANTDVLDRSIPPPTPENPVYYIAVSKGYRQFGYDQAGEKIPDSTGVLGMVTKILDSQGYKVATAEHAPSIMILYSWGDFYINPNPGVRITYAREMLEFLGAYKVGVRTDSLGQVFPELSPGLTSINPDSSTVVGFLPHGMYVITFWAFDFNLALKGEARLLWKTNISSSTRGFYLPEVLPTMLTVAAPLIGRETSRPIRIDVGKDYKPRVELGPLRVIEEDVKFKKGKYAAPPVPTEGAARLESGSIQNLPREEHDLITGKPGDPKPRTRPILPPDLTQRITSYEQEKAALQAILTAKIKDQAPGPDTRRAIESFNEENARRIRALGRMGASIRGELAQLRAANSASSSPNPDESLDILLRQFATDVRQLEHPPADTP